MSVEVLWHDDEQTVLRVCFIGSWTWKMYLTAFEKIIEMGAVVSYPFYIVYDLTRSDTLLPSNPHQIMFNTSNRALNEMPNWQHTCFVSERYLHVTMYNMLMRMVPRSKDKFSMMKTFDQALNHITQLAVIG